MVDFDGLKDKAEDLLAGHADQVESGLDKAADLLGNKFGHESQIDSAVDKIKGFIPGGQDDAPAAPPQTPEAPAQ